MSEARIAVVAEGPIDTVIIGAALRAVLQRPFILNQLQPEATSQPKLGNGWCGVFKWCLQFRERGAGSLEADATLAAFDLVIIHVDADIADSAYSDGGADVVEAARALEPLPCSQPCPPASATVTSLEQVLRSWLGIPGTGPKSLFCIPSKASDAWLAAAVLPDNHPLLAGLECKLHLATNLENLKLKLRVRKNVGAYRARAAAITSHWAQVMVHCAQAAKFDEDIRKRTENFPI